MPSKYTTPIYTYVQKDAPEMSAAPEAPRFVMTTFQRSGTHWLKHMVSFAMGVPPLETRFYDRVDQIKKALDNEGTYRLCYEHFDFGLHSCFLNLRDYPGLRMISLYRNPLDALISQYHFRAATNALLEPERSAIENLKSYLHGGHDAYLGRKRYFKTWPLLGLRDYIKNYIVDWVRSDFVFSVRYEELVADTPRNLAAVMKHLEIPCSAETLAEAVERFSFKNLSGGRSKGAEDRSSHYRRGISGEWQTVFDAEDLATIRREIGDYLDFLGYPL